MILGSKDIRVIEKVVHKTKRKVRSVRKIRIATNGINVLERAKKLQEERGYKGPYVFPAARIMKNNAKVPHFTSSWELSKRLSEKVGFKFTPGQFRSAYINFTLSACEANSRDFSEALQLVAQNVGHADVRVTLKHYMESRVSKAEEAARNDRSSLSPSRNRSSTCRCWRFAWRARHVGQAGRLAQDLPPMRPLAQGPARQQPLAVWRCRWKAGWRIR